MVWSLLRRGRATLKLPLPSVCGHRRHCLRTERLLLYTPETMLDIAAVSAAASDPGAQRWLGWGESVVTDARVREALTQMLPGDASPRLPFPRARRLLAEPFQPHPDHGEILVGVRLDDGRYAGATQLNTSTGEVGGWLAPHARGRGLGTELFQAAALLGHAHMGLHTVRAGCEPANTSSAQALTGAGFVADYGPPSHTLPDGREVDARWLRHTTTELVGTCAAAAA